MTSSLADHLRALPDDGLMGLIRLRPDLVIPPPSDFSALAHRAQSRVAVARALDGLDTFTLEILDALRYTRVGHTSSVEAVLALTAPAGVEAARVRAAVDLLRAYAVAYGPDQAVRIVGAVDEVCSPYPLGLGRPAEQLDPVAGALVGDAAGLRRTLLAAPPAARAVLDRLAAGPPVGTVTPASLEPGSDSPVRWLVDRHLLVAVGRDAVELPVEISLVLRRDAGPLGQLHPDPPPMEAPQRDPARVDHAGAGQVLELVRNAEALVETIGAEPPAVLRSGGLGIRELRRYSKTVGVDEQSTALMVEIVTAAGLLGEEIVDTKRVESVFLPTVAYDAWRAMGIAARWHRLAVTWLTMTRAPSLVGQRDDRDRPINALAPELSRPGAPAQRRAALQVLADLPPGATAAPAAVVDVLAWRAPRRITRGVSAGVEASLAEAAFVGLTGFDGLTSYGRLVLEELASDTVDADDPLGLNSPDGMALIGSAALLDTLLPAPVDHVLLQADLSVIVPGPPEPGLAVELELLGTQESASVYRITPDTVRRSLDAGYSAGDLHALLARRSRTPVPQTLTYLIDDMARKHGGMRVGSANSYVRSDDESLIAEVLADRRLQPLNLRRLAPTVLASRHTPQRLLEALREAGYPPIQEDATGAAVLARPKVRRGPPRPTWAYRGVEDPAAGVRLSTPRLAGVIEQIRRGDAAARVARRAPVTVRANGAATASHTEALEVLQQALRDKTRVWVGYIDAHGATASRLVRPVSMGSGYLRAEDERTEMLHTFALHRITAAAPEEG
ncbi:helicase-associated domain-containing protein [Dactylosporangium sp. AC04546]|uniref:helicase-associated domain-containing protein n=1 Tax=Dactylosporangium sp. AC04546 TaxID=2862460 RepID=UPI001EDEFB2A|nr:helicase-associated domain-containing protein [Dactylosporangium sp. AC04546]WVK83457.1 helicase-associated domain-containing protein [Dactylosporangium sp. AC04546]